MTDMVTLIAKTNPLERELKTASRTVQDTDLQRLGELYYSAYDAGAAGAGENLSAAMSNMRSAMEGKYGQVLHEASHVALDADGEIVAAVLVVDHFTGEGAPDAPFIIELITDRNHRRRGLAEELVLATMDTLFNEGRHNVALKVDSTNSAALALYLSLNFYRWSPDYSDD